MALFSCVTTSDGVALGAIIPSQIVASNLGTPASPTVGVLAIIAERFLPVVAIALTLFSLTNSFIVVMASNIMST